jgi:hypothetical protein
MIINKDEDRWIESGNIIRISFRINLNILIKIQFSTL